MLGSNQRPLPCEGRALSSPAFAVVQNRLQNGAFSLSMSRVCSPLFVWVGVLIGVNEPRKAHSYSALQAAQRGGEARGPTQSVVRHSYALRETGRQLPGDGGRRLADDLLPT